MGALAIRIESSPIQIRDCSESVLIEQLLRGNDDAWSEFIRRYRALIYHCITKVVVRYTRDTSEAEVDEIYAEMLVMLLKDDMRKLRMFNPERGNKLGSWIGMLTINGTHDYLRCASRRPWMERLDPEPESLPARQITRFTSCAYTRDVGYSPSPLDMLMEKERWIHLEDLLTDFSEKDRQFLHLFYDKGLDAAAIAERMAISIKTVYSKKHKIREHLRRSVRNAGCTCAIREFAA